MSRAVTVKRLTGGAALGALERRWLRLFASAPDATPFQHPAWVCAWWRHLPKGTPEILAAFDGERLAGLLPLCRTADGARQVLRPMGFDVSDYAEPLVAAGDRDGTIAALLDALARLPGWDLCRLILRSAPCIAGADLHARSGPAAPSPALDLPHGADLPKGMRGSLKESHRRLRTFGAATFEEATEASADRILDTLFALHARRWHESGGVLAHPAVQAFHRDAAAGLARAGLLRLTLMRLAGAPAAAFYGFAAGRTVFYYIGGFHPAFAPASPGNLVVAREIARAAGDGFALFDFLKGAEPYKYRWGAADRARHAVELSPPGAPSHARRHVPHAAGALR